MGWMGSWHGGNGPVGTQGLSYRRDLDSFDALSNQGPFCSILLLRNRIH